MSNYIKDIADYIQTSTIATEGTTLFIGRKPDKYDGTADNLISLFETTGLTPIANINGIYEPTFQVQVRNSDYATGVSKADTIRNLLHTLANTTLGSTYFYFIIVTQERTHIGEDDSGRDIFSINFRARYR